MNGPQIFIEWTAIFRVNPTNIDCFKILQVSTPRLLQFQQESFPACDQYMAHVNASLLVAKVMTKSYFLVQQGIISWTSHHSFP